MSVLETGCSLTLLHTRGYGTHRVVLSVCLLPTMATSNGHNSETTSSIATKRGIEMEELHSPMSKAYRRNVKLEKLR